MALRDRTRHGSAAWRALWRLHEERERARWAARRLGHRVSYRLKPWACIAGGTDCDGMRYASCALYWRRKSAERAADYAYQHAEGPAWANVVSGREGRAWEASYEPDTRDRYAERMGY